jgi:hypothetical protein
MAGPQGQYVLYDKKCHFALGFILLTMFAGSKQMNKKPKNCWPKEDPRKWPLPGVYFMFALLGRKFQALSTTL